MMAFCVAPGPAFVVTFVGWGIWGSLERGWLLFAAVTLSGLLLGILSGLGKPFPQERAQEKDPPSGSALVLSVSDACSATAKMLRLHSALRRNHRHPPGQRSVPAAGRAAGGRGSAAGGRGPGRPILCDGGHRRRGRRGPGWRPACLICLRAGLWRALRSPSALFLFSEIPLSKGKFFLFRVLHGAGYRRTVSAAGPAGSRGKRSGVGGLHPASPL